MRFSRGTKVEVLSKKKVPSGSWRCAEVLADDGDDYVVRYCRSPGIYSERSEKVPLEAVRPCPPPDRGPRIFAVDDVVEVLDDGYWKTSVIQEVMGDNSYHIHVIGSIDDFRAEKSDMRLRQEWRENKWVPIEKGCGPCEYMMSRFRKRMLMQQKSFNDKVLDIQESGLSESLKRSSPCTSDFDEAFIQPVQKRRAVEKDVYEYIHGDSHSFVGKGMWKLVSLAATCLKMMLWLAIALLSSRGIVFCR